MWRVAVETYLGWTLMGKAPQNGAVNSNLAVTVTSLFIKVFEISDIWKFDLIGIHDPIEKKTKEQVHVNTWSHFRRIVKTADTKCVYPGKRIEARYVRIGI
jgi:hypothetical protein